MDTFRGGQKGPKPKPYLSEARRASGAYDSFPPVIDLSGETMLIPYANRDVVCGHRGAVGLWHWVRGHRTHTEVKFYGEQSRAGFVSFDSGDTWQPVED